VRLLRWWRTHGGRAGSSISPVAGFGWSAGSIGASQWVRPARGRRLAIGPGFRKEPWWWFPDRFQGRCGLGRSKGAPEAVGWPEPGAAWEPRGGSDRRLAAGRQRFSQRLRAGSGQRSRGPGEGGNGEGPSALRHGRFSFRVREATSEAESGFGAAVDRGFDPGPAGPAGNRLQRVMGSGPCREPVQDRFFGSRGTLPVGGFRGGSRFQRNGPGVGFIGSNRPGLGSGACP